jgi:DNA-binding transcriptional LysR family regulator
VEISNISDRTQARLEAGEIDLAVGFVPDMAAGYFQQALFDEHFVCLTRPDHPRIKRRPTLAQFEAESHVVVTTSGTGHLIIDRTLEEKHIRRKVAARIPNFLGLAMLIGCTDLVCTLPRRAGMIMALSQQVSAWPTPFDLPTYTVKQYWHERQARDPGNKWLRGLMTELFANK